MNRIDTAEHFSRRDLMLGLALSAVLGLVISGCGGSSEPGDRPRAEGRPQYGGTAVFGVFGDVDSFSEFVKTSQLADQIDDYMLFMSLIR